MTTRMMINEPSINQWSGHSHIFWQIPAASCHPFAVVFPQCRVSRCRTYQKGQQRVSSHLKGWMNQPSPYGVYSSWEIILPTVLEECFDHIHGSRVAYIPSQCQFVQHDHGEYPSRDWVEFAWQSAGWHNPDGIGVENASDKRRCPYTRLTPICECSRTGDKIRVPTFPRS